MLSVSMFSPLHPFEPERLPWLICSILQYMALQDGPCHATLSTTSSMALRAQASMYLVRGIQLPKTRWGLPRKTQPPIGNGAKSTTSTCTGLGTARAAPIWALFLSRSHMRPSIHGSIVTGSPQKNINGSAIRIPALHVQFSLQDHQTSCTLD